MSKTENAKKPCKKKQKSPEERLKEARASSAESQKHWLDIYENGCSDPTWPDGVNLNLVRNHIIHYQGIIRECCDELGVEYTETDIPPQVDADYIAKPEVIVRDAKRALDELSSDPNYKELVTLRASYTPKQLESICYPAVVGYVRNLKYFIEENDLVAMRRYRRYERYAESFKQCIERAKELTPEEVQLSLFDMTA